MLWKSTTDLMESGDIELTFGADDDSEESRSLNEGKKLFHHFNTFR